jgi:hypothetical protein
MKRSVTIIVVGLALFAAAVAAEVFTQPRRWVRTIAFVAWCIAAFGAECITASASNVRARGAETAASTRNRGLKVRCLRGSLFKINN